MKKTITLLFFIIFVFDVGLSQKVDSIRVEQSGDFIKIRYKILDSEPGEIYRVKVLCSINGGLNTELRSISGDAGDQVPGGKPEYWAVWDVLKDVDEVKSVDFIVRAELVESYKSRSENTKIFNFSGSVQVPGPTFGARLGIMGKFGVSLHFTRGLAVLHDEPLYNEEPVFNRYSLDFTSRLINKNNTQLHLLTGLTVGNAIILETYSTADPYGGSQSHFKKSLTPGPELGLAFCTKRLIFTATGTKLLTGMTEDGKSISQNFYIALSAGVRF